MRPALLILLLGLLALLGPGCGHRRPAREAGEDLDAPVDLRVAEHAFVEGRVPCWVVATAGLQAVGQKELVFIVRQEPGLTQQGVVDSLWPFVKKVHALASEGRYVDEGGFSELSASSRGFLGRPDLLGVLYAAPQPIAGLDLPQPHLLAILVTAEERSLSGDYGRQRVLARLGERSRFYPTPPWSEAGREPVTSPQDGESILAQVPRMHLQGSSIYRESIPVGAGIEGESWRVVLDLTPSAGAALREALAAFPADGALAILSDYDPRWDAMFVWFPGQQEPQVIGAHDTAGLRVGGNFLAVAPGAQQDARQVVEDGFAALLTAESWAALRRAIEQEQPLDLAGPRGEGLLSLRWRPEGVAGGAVRLDHVVLLTPEPAIARATSATELAGFIQGIHAAVEQGIAGASAGEGADLAVDCTLRPGEDPVFNLALRPQASEELAPAILAALRALPAPTVRGEVRFQVLLTLWGGTGAPLAAPP